MPIAPEGRAAKVKAPANDLGFYSTVEKAALNLQRKSGTGDSFLADLMKNPGVSESRLEEMGLTALRGEKNVTADEVRALASENKVLLEESVKREYEVGTHGISDAEYIAEHIQGRIEKAKNDLFEAKLNDDHGLAYRLEQQIKYDEEELANLDYGNGLVKGDAKFGPETHPDYNMPGGENYREIRVKLPTKRLTEDEARKVLGASPNAKLSEADITFASNKNKDQFFNEAHHGNEPDVLFHLRVAEHGDAEGKKGLLIDELQSDWHQQGRDKGYGYFNGYKVTEPSGQLFGEYSTKAEAESALARAKSGSVVEQSDEIYMGVPNAPFKDNWYQLGLKRAIKEATDSGMDRVYLTTGKTQADRYDLSKQVDNLLYSKNLDGTYRVSAQVQGRGQMIGEAIPESKLSDYVGKEVAEKMSKGTGKQTEVAGEYDPASMTSNKKYMTELSGIDLKVGGEGMKKYYDEIYPNFLNKYGKKYGAQVGETEIKTGNAYSQTKGIPAKETVRYLDITPEMRKAVKKGQPLAAVEGMTGLLA